MSIGGTMTSSTGTTLSPQEQAELTAYTASTGEQGVLSLKLPLAAEPHVTAWEGYLARSKVVGVADALKEAIVQLQFGIVDGISETETYRAATRRGEFPDAGPGIAFAAPAGLRLTLHEGAAGPIPVLVTTARQDFVSLVQAFSKRNEPKPVPDTMGATMIAGMVNWDRVRTRRLAWQDAPAEQREHPTWEETFQAMVPDKSAYQDRLILLSEGPYSNVPAANLGLEDAEWRALSLEIRREHEYTHYFTKRVLGSMRNNMLDELIADAMGLLAATGRFQADWFLHFVGLENYPVYRLGGRLENYRGTPPLSDGAFAGLGELVMRAARTLESYLDAATLDGRDVLTRARLVLGLSSLTLDDLAGPEGASKLAEAVAKQSSVT
jgi:hypothetical protein